jgi:hypothetical protein
LWAQSSLDLALSSVEAEDEAEIRPATRSTGQGWERRASSGAGHPFRPGAPWVPRGCPGIVRTFFTSSRRPAGPLAPPTRRPRRSSRWRSHFGGLDSRSAGAKPNILSGPPHRSDVPRADRPSLPGRGWLPAPSLSAAARTRQGRLRRRLRRRPLTEPARQSRSSQLSGARGGTGRMARPTCLDG